MNNKLFSKTTAKYIAMITQVGVMMMVPIFMCLAIGLILDKIFNVRFIGITGLILGILAGFRNTYIMVMNSLKQDEQNRKGKKHDKCL